MFLLYLNQFNQTHFYENLPCRFSNHFKFLFFIINSKCQAQDKPVEPPDSALKNMTNLLNYYSAHLRLSQDFVSYDAHMKIISKPEFFQQVITGDYLPLLLSSKSGMQQYKLYKLKASTNDDVRRMLKQIGNTDYGTFQTIGKPFPPFHYVDLNGNVYTPENTKGKILIIKAWDTECVPCIAEMPELNKLTEQYKSRKDIVFVSIAWNTKKELEKFTKRVTFKYAVVPVKAAYIEKTLLATGYPAHWVVNKQGIVVSMSYDKNEMIMALNKLAKK